MRVLVSKVDDQWRADLMNGIESLSVDFREEWMARSFGTDLAETLECELSIISEEDL